MICNCLFIIKGLTISVLWWRAEIPKLHLVSVDGRLGTRETGEI